jgi:hypothetical protein
LFHFSPKFLQALSRIGDNAQLLGGEDGAEIIDKYVTPSVWRECDFAHCVVLSSKRQRFIPTRD